MDQALFYAQYLLSDRERAHFNRAWLDGESIPDAILDRLRTRYSAQVIRDHYENIVARCEELEIERVDLLEGSLSRKRVEPLADPPGALFLRGNIGLLEATPAVGVVGTRRGTERGRRVARGIGSGLARAGVLVVSGMALGVDGASHEGCLDAGGKGLAWLAGGVEMVAPPRHRGLYHRLRTHGLLASEYPPQTPVRKHYFVARNRLIAAYSDALVVVEAGERSGTRSTVEFMLDLGRDLYCVPGPVDCPHSTGTLRWIRDGATMVRDAADVLEDMGVGTLELRPRTVLGLGPAPESTLSIARRSGIGLAEVAATLARAQANGEVERLAGDRWCAASALPR